MRKLIYIFLILSTFNKSFSQELFGQKNTVEITQEWFFDHSEFKQPERKEIKIFDKKGRLVKDIEFGFHHNVNLKLIGKIRSFEYQKNKLISEKTYTSGTTFQNNQVQFYWNYFYENDNKTKVVSNHSNYNYKYDDENRLTECNIDYPLRSEQLKYVLKYNTQNKIIEKSQFYGNNIKNWTTTYEVKGDTLISNQYSFNFPKEKDTTITTIRKVYKDDKLSYSRTEDFTENEKKYVYEDNGKLIYVFTKVIDEGQKELKTELTYYKNGLIKEIRKYALESNSWVLKQKTKFGIGGKESILNKKETESVNEILINGNKNWLQQHV